MGVINKDILFNLTQLRGLGFNMYDRTEVLNQLKARGNYNTFEFVKKQTILGYLDVLDQVKNGGNRNV